MSLASLASLARTIVTQRLSGHDIGWHVRHLTLADLLSLPGGEGVFLGLARPPEPPMPEDLPDDIREAQEAATAARAREAVPEQVRFYEEVVRASVVAVEHEGATDKCRLVPAEEEDPSAGLIPLGILDQTTMQLVATAAMSALFAAREEVLPFRPVAVGDNDAG